jgi:hypothetical protein
MIYIKEKKNKTNNKYKDNILKIIKSLSKITSINLNQHPSYNKAYTVLFTIKAKARKSKSKLYS